MSADARRRLSPEHRFKTRAEMQELFADLPEATDTSVEIAMRSPIGRDAQAHLPRFSIPGAEAVDEEGSCAGRRARASKRGSPCTASRPGRHRGLR